MRVVVCGAGLGGLTCAVRLADAGHEVVVVEAWDAPGGKAGRATLPGGYVFDTGPSLLTMPHVVREVLGDEVPLVRVEPVTRYRFADGSCVDLSADLPVAHAALEAWSPGAGEDWARFLGLCAGMWAASSAFLTGPPPWPPRADALRGAGARPDPRDALRVRPWMTLRQVARACARDPRLRMVIERFGTYAGADPRRAPAVLALAGYVEHAFGAWHVAGGLYEIVLALVRRLEAAGGEVRCGVRAERIAGREVGTSAGALTADAVVWNGDAAALDPLLGRAPRRALPERSLSGLALMLALGGRSDETPHHTITFPADYDAEFDDLFAHRRPVRDPTLYASVSCATTPSEAPADGENWFVLANAPAIAGAHVDWEAEADRITDRLGVSARVRARLLRTPTDLRAQTGAVDGAIYGAAPHGRLATLRRPPNRVRGHPRVVRVGGTTHPGGGVPLVMLSGILGAREVAALA